MRVNGKSRTVSSLLDGEWFSVYFFSRSGLKQISRVEYQTLADKYQRAASGTVFFRNALNKKKKLVNIET